MNKWWGLFLPEDTEELSLLPISYIWTKLVLRCVFKIDLCDMMDVCQEISVNLIFKRINIISNTGSIKVCKIKSSLAKKKQ